jgi:hypothetical protein
MGMKTILRSITVLKLHLTALLSTMTTDTLLPFVDINGGKQCIYTRELHRKTSCTHCMKLLDVKSLCQLNMNGKTTENTLLSKVPPTATSGCVLLMATHEGS